jgi:8-oxo-dGTP pyrophosphatase MutT (NUDIX family)
MNRKIYFNNTYILLTDEEFQRTENQVIIETDNLSEIQLKEILKKFLREGAQKSYVFPSKNLNSILDRVKKEFRFIEAAGGLIQKENAYLFIYRLDKWDLPKGKIDRGENPEQAAIRECVEECGIDGLSITGELPSSYHIYPHKGSHVLKKTYWYAMTTSDETPLKPQTEENIEKAEWLGIDEIKETVLKNTYPGIRDLILFSCRMD